MAIKVRLKTLKNGNPEIIHPETDWSIVLNRPSIAVGSNSEVWGKPGGSYICLKENGIYVKDYRSNEVLLENYPIKWSAVQKRPNITATSDGSLQTWSVSGGSGIRLSRNEIYVKDSKSGDYSLLENYPINIKWSAISGKPDYLPVNSTETTFGRYVIEERLGGADGYHRTVYPAIRRCERRTQSAPYEYMEYYFKTEDRQWYICPSGEGIFYPGL